MTKKRFEFEVAKATEGYRMFDYEKQEPYYVPYDELLKDEKLLAKLLKKEMHRFTGLWNKGLLSEEILKKLTKTAVKAGLEVTPINELIENTISMYVKEKDGSKDK